MAPNIIIWFIVFVIVACAGWWLINWVMGMTGVTGNARQVVIVVYAIICLAILIFEFLIPMLSGAGGHLGRI